MSFFRNLLSDLISKRLWPVAVALVAALVAVPMVLSSTPAAVGDASLPVAAAGAATNHEVALVTDPGVKDRKGDKRNPFLQNRVVSAADAAAAAGAAAAAAAATGTAGAGTAGATDATVPGSGVGVGATTPDTAGTTTTTGTTPTETAPPKATKSYEVDLAFGLTGQQVTHENLPRLAPLPSADNPFLVFLGVLGDGRTAAFLVSSDTAKITGNGTCRPNPDDCQTIEVAAGDTVFFDVEPGEGDAAAGTTTTSTTPDGSITTAPATTQYQLDVRKVTGRVSSSYTDPTGQIADTQTTESALGRKALRAAIDAGASAVVGRYGYSSENGTLERTDHYGVVVRSGPKGAATIRTDVKRLQPLPSRAEADLVYVGVRSDRRAAVFQNVAGGPKGGQGACTPTPADCRLLELGVGETAFFDRSASGHGMQELGLQQITQTGTGSVVAARRARTSESAFGRKLLRQSIAAGATELVQRFRYDARVGLVRSAKTK